MPSMMRCLDLSAMIKEHSVDDLSFPPRAPPPCMLHQRLRSHAHSHTSVHAQTWTHALTRALHRSMRRCSAPRTGRRAPRQRWCGCRRSGGRRRRGAGRWRGTTRRGTRHWRTRRLTMRWGGGGAGAVCNLLHVVVLGGWQAGRHAGGHRGRPGKASSSCTSWWARIACLRPCGAAVLPPRPPRRRTASAQCWRVRTTASGRRPGQSCRSLMTRWVRGPLASSHPC